MARRKRDARGGVDRSAAATAVASDADRFVKRKRPLATPETMAASMNIHAEGMW